ncbi:nuclear transport factor 2 family protein [Haloactinomyces albus]|uniref:Ketosteroid isomerase-like protein n=1 Tax=Haloactinomyces albus TaxID=1352928 RepID=A0AAE3ZHZ8_9ACTN|nr:nuclear transport factor 2 family protein [Haloactinomyces albus]MDR7303964.1 ketosteroid isomerase-like protein [Haloactinomyces albus]
MATRVTDSATAVQEIINVTHRYALGLDRSDPDEAINAFTDDAYWDATAVGLERFEGREQILEFFRRDAAAMAEQYHAITNHIVEFDGQDTAHGTNYVLAEGRTKSGGSIKAAAINEDTYRDTPDGWRISGRTITPLTTPQMEEFDA